MTYHHWGPKGEPVHSRGGGGGGGWSVQTENIESEEKANKTGTKQHQDLSFGFNWNKSDLSPLGAKKVSRCIREGEGEGDGAYSLRILNRRRRIARDASENQIVGCRDQEGRGWRELVEMADSGEAAVRLNSEGENAGSGCIRIIVLEDKMRINYQ